MFKHTLIAGALAAGLITIGATTASANGNGNGNGPVVEHFEDQFSDVDEFLSDICGFEVLFAVDNSATVRFWPDGLVHVTEQGSVVLTNAATGRTLTNWWRLNGKFRGTETVEDGILTITFQDRFTGIPSQWIGDDGKTLLKDRGYAEFVGEIVVDLGDPEDPFDDELLHFHEEIVTHGPHPILEADFGPETACELLS